MGGDGSDRLFAGLSDLDGVGDGAIVWDGGRGSDTLDLSEIPYDVGKGVWIELSFTARSTSFLRTNVDKNDQSLRWDATFDTTYNNNFRNIENVIGGAGDDLIQFANGGGSNVIRGGAGNDYLSAADGSDTIYGGDGNDMIMGGWGSDTLYGDSGNDVFLITGRVVNEYTFDVIKDFDPKADPTATSFDQIWLWESWSVQWDANSPDVLRGHLIDNGVIFGEITLEGLTYADAPFVPVYNVDMSTGMPFG
jgi:Ca2+-binding RTX toxin-like protein